MEKYIEKIIEIILDNVTCEHQEIRDEYPHPRYDDVTYSLDNEQEVIKKCLVAIPDRLIEKPLVTKEWIEKKAKNLWICLDETNENYIKIIKDFICSLLDELAAKINLKGD